MLTATENIPDSQTDSSLPEYKYVYLRMNNLKSV